ncbi:MAG: glycogen/starch synthase [Bacteroidaceae bacterium]|nr:glycogen/starch synthase [Bacteroidaceae bacterium]
MKAKKILFICQEMIPYMDATQMAYINRHLPQTVQTEGAEIRIFMPRWGVINERRNQLHEVIRLSGMNIIINESDHPLIIKVASVPQSRMQVYFIDNDDFFKNRQVLSDAETGEYADNMERAIFFARGVLETIRKLCWIPDIIVCQGWVASLAPFMIKTAYRNDPPFVNTRVVYQVDAVRPRLAPPADFEDCLAQRGVDFEEVRARGIDLTQPEVCIRLATEYSDAIVQAVDGAMSELVKAAQEAKKPVLKLKDIKKLRETYTTFFDTLL